MPNRHRLDVLGTFCPLPILLSARQMQALHTGDLLEVVGDDPTILEDMPIWCRQAGHRLLELREEEGKVLALVEKGEPRPRRPRKGTGRRAP